MSLAVVEPARIENIEEEAALLGAMMQERSLIDQIADRLRSEHFAEPLHGRIFDAIVSLHSQGRPATPVTLKPLFSDDPAMKAVGGSSYLVTIMGSHGVAVIGAKGFADDIRELALRRKLIDGLKEIITAGHDQTNGLKQLVSGAEETLALIVPEGEAAKEISAANAVGALLKRIEEGLPPGVSSSIESLDAALGPIRRGDLAIIAGRPGMGKTLAALSYAKGAALQGHGVLFISLEMSSEQLAMRLAANL
jgi:replicative DNA helicase